MLSYTVGFFPTAGLRHRCKQKSHAQTERGKSNKASFSTYICERRGTASKTSPVPNRADPQRVRLIQVPEEEQTDHPNKRICFVVYSLSVKHKSIKARLEKVGGALRRPTSVVVLLQRVGVTDVEMKPWRCCSWWGRRGFKLLGPGGINTSNAGDRAMKGEMASKHGSSNQQAYALTYYEDSAAQHLPSLASAPSICCVCTEYKPTSTLKCTAPAARRGVERGAA